MSAAKAKPKSKPKSTGATSAAKKTIAAGGERIGRGTRWTDEQVSLLLETVKSSATAKQAFEQVAKQLGKSTGTVQQKYYNLQKQTGGAVKRRRGRPRGSKNVSRPSVGTTTRTSAGSGLPNAASLRSLTVDELVGLATSVKSEIDRRRKELDAASKLLAG